VFADGWTCRGLAILAALGFSAAAYPTHASPKLAADWTIKPPADTSLLTDSTLEVGLPATLSAAQIAHLGVEIDDIDVTALAHIGGGEIVYTPPQPLTVGPHQLRVVEYASDGRLTPRGEWKFTTRLPGNKVAAARGWSVKGNAGATASERIAESNLTPPAPPRFTANGTFDVKGVRTISEWTATGDLQGLYGSDNGVSSVGGQGLQPAQMQLALEHAKDGLILGDQTLPFDNLLISGLSRRGVSGHLANMPLGSDGTAFSVRDSALTGFYGGLGVTDPNDNVSGVILRSHPLPQSPRALALLFGFVTGNAPAGLSYVVPYPGGNGSFPPRTPLGTVMPVQSGSGNAWVVGVSGRIPKSTLQLSAQWAGSNFNFPGTPGQSATPASDTASSFALNYGIPLGTRWTLSANANYEDVGTFFTSLANATLPPDRRTATAQGSLSGHGLVLGLSGGFTQDNADGNAAIPTVRSVPRSLTVSYGPTLPTRVTSWLGTPSVSVAWQDARTDDVTQPAGSLATSTDASNGSVNLNFSYARVSWQAGLTDGEFRDYTGQQDDTNTFGPTVGFMVTAGAGASVGFNLQIIDSHDLNQDSHTRDYNYSLSAADALMDNKLSAQLTLAINHNTQQVVPGLIPPQLVGGNVTLKTATAQFLWHAVAATRARGGLDVGLSSSWNESSGLNTAVLTSQGFSSLATHGLQTFLTLSSSWPIALGGP
jgi:hypothetical protein